MELELGCSDGGEEGGIGCLVSGSCSGIVRDVSEGVYGGGGSMDGLLLSLRKFMFIEGIFVLDSVDRHLSHCTTRAVYMGLWPCPGDWMYDSRHP